MLFLNVKYTVKSLFFPQIIWWNKDKYLPLQT